MRGSVAVGTTGQGQVLIDHNLGIAYIHLLTGAAHEPVNGYASVGADIANTGLASEYLRLSLVSPAIDVIGRGSAATHVLTSEAEDGTLGARHIFSDGFNINTLTLDVTNRTANLNGVLTGANIAGSVAVSFTAQTSFTLAVTFPQAFATVPAVMTNINTGSGVTSHWSSRAIGVTTSGFTIFVYSDTGAAAQTWASIPVQWIAIGT